MSADYIRQHYQLPFVKKGLKINMNGKSGTISGFARSGAYLMVKFDDGSSGPVHPTWKMTYYGSFGDIIKQFMD